MSVKIKIPIENVEKEDVCTKVEETLRKDKKNAYTISGIMIETFKVKEVDIENKSFRAWKKGLPALYAKISNCLKRLEKIGKVKSKKDGKAFVYWLTE